MLTIPGDARNGATDEVPTMACSTAFAQVPCPLLEPLSADCAADDVRRLVAGFAGQWHVMNVPHQARFGNRGI